MDKFSTELCYRVNADIYFLHSELPSQDTWSLITLLQSMML